jgi:hypothetical protein
MPFKYITNNHVLPANSRAVDVASKAIVEIIPAAQARMYNAFIPQGISCILYTHLTNGRKCTCQSSQKQLNGLLNKEGKASIGTINQLLINNMNFDVTPYNYNQGSYIPEAQGQNGQTSPLAPQNKYQGVFDIATTGEEFPFAHIMDEGVGDNGQVSSIDIDDLVKDFDASVLGFSEVSCGICFGTGFVGGYAPYHAYRRVFTVADLNLKGDINYLKHPWSATVSYFNQKITLPRGAIAVDVFRVLNGINIVPSRLFVDSIEIKNINTLLQKCDGKLHILEAYFDSEFTHFEMQFSLTTESTYFEFPRRSSSADTSLLEQADPFQIILSPNVPSLDSTDIIVESQLGKVLVVQNVNPWESRQRNTLGWEAQVRVIQPQEIYRILPQRGRTMNKDSTTKMVRDNVTGIYRT